MTPFAVLLANTAKRLPLAPMESYAGVIKILQRAAVVVDRQEKRIATMCDNQDVVHIQYKGKCT